MTARLTSQQRDALEQRGYEPVEVVDPDTDARYFLVPAEVFERIKRFIDAEYLDIRDTYAAQSAVAGTAGWDDREMDVYDNHEAYKPRP